MDPWVSANIHIRENIEIVHMYEFTYYTYKEQHYTMK